jgi:nicotinamidase-related amidase
LSDQEEKAADLLAVLLAGRSDQLADLALGHLAAPLAPELAAMREGLAAIALANEPVAPSAGLRARILCSMEKATAAPKRALVVIDMQNDALNPGGPLEVPRAREIVPALASRIETARREGTPVVYVVDVHEPDDSDLDSWAAHNIAGSKGADVWPALAPMPGDTVVQKPTYSAFTRSRFADVLKELRVDTLVLTGCLTEVGVLATATEALQRGYAVEVPPDSQAGATEANEQVAMGIMQLLPPYGPAREALLESLRAA